MAAEQQQRQRRSTERNHHTQQAIPRLMNEMGDRPTVDLTLSGSRSVTEDITGADCVDLGQLARSEGVVGAGAADQRCCHPRDQRHRIGPAHLAATARGSRIDSPARSRSVGLMVKQMASGCRKFRSARESAQAARRPFGRSATGAWRSKTRSTVRTTSARRSRKPEAHQAWANHQQPNRENRRTDSGHYRTDQRVGTECRHSGRIRR